MQPAHLLPAPPYRIRKLLLQVPAGFALSWLVGGSVLGGGGSRGGVGD